MKKLILIAALLFPVILVAGIGTLLFAANRVGEKAQRTFFDVVATEDADQLIEMLDPAVRDEVDAPVLACWMQAINENLGQFEGISSTDFQTDVSTAQGVQSTDSSGTVRFARGEARSSIVYTNGLISQFSVESDSMKGDWFQGPKQTDLYRSRAVSFCQAFVDGDVQAVRKPMHEALREQVSEEAQADMMKNIRDFAGEVKEIQVIDDEYNATESDGQRLAVHLMIIGDNGKLDAAVTYQFIGLGSQLISFNFSPTDQSVTD